MNPFRHPIVQRVVAFLLLAGTGVACAPAARATSSATLENALRGALGDAEAVELAILAARRAATPESALEAFVEVYTAETGDPAAAEAIGRLLEGLPNRFGAPAVPPSEAVWTPASSTVPLVQRAGADAPTQAQPPVRLVVLGRVGPQDPPAPPAPRALRTQQPRAP